MPLNLPKFGRTKGQRERSSQSADDKDSSVPPNEGADAPPDARQQDNAQTNQPAGAPPSPATGDMMTAAEMLADDAPVQKKSVFAWWGKISLRLKIMGCLLVLMVLLPMVMPAGKGQRRAPDKTKSATEIAKSSQDSEPAVASSQPASYSQKPSHVDDLDEGAASSVYPQRDMLRSSADPDAESSVKTFGGKKQDNTYKPYARTVAAATLPSQSATAAAASRVDDTSTELSSDELKNERAGAPRGVVVAGSQNSKNAPLREMLRMDGDPAQELAKQIKDSQALAAMEGQRSRPNQGSGGNKASAGESKELEDFAPYGRMVKCRLIFTVDSISTGAPIIALVTEDLWWNGRLIIPANTEIFSTVAGTKRDLGHISRIMDDGKWKVVLPEQDGRINGREFDLSGMALERSETVVENRGRVRSWSLDDGAPGLLGETIETTSKQELLMLASAGLSGLAKGFSAVRQTQQAAPGMGGAFGATESKPSLGNALWAGGGDAAQEVLSKYAEKIQQEIAENGSYVRVSGGKDFYVFVKQTLQPLQARVALANRITSKASGTPTGSQSGLNAMQ